MRYIDYNSRLALYKKKNLIKNKHFLETKESRVNYPKQRAITNTPLYTNVLLSSRKSQAMPASLFAHVVDDPNKKVDSQRRKSKEQPFCTGNFLGVIPTVGSQNGGKKPTLTWRFVNSTESDEFYKYWSNSCGEFADK